MDEQFTPNSPREPVKPAVPPVPPVQPVPQWTPPPPPPTYAIRKQELLFGLMILVCNIFMWDCIIGGGFNLGFAIGAVCVVLCSAVYLISAGYKFGWYSGGLLGLSILIAAAFGRSADGIVKYVMVHFLLVAVNLSLCLAAGQNLRSPAGVTSLLDAPRSLFQLGFGSFGAAGRGLNDARKNAGTFGKKGSAVAVGLIVAIPIIALLISLLIQADAAFEGLVNLLPETDWEEIFTAVIFGAGCGWLLFCRGVGLRRAEKGKKPAGTFKGIHPLTVNTLLIAVCLVYMVYLVSQLAYLSGGFSGILPEEYTMAQYARRGFFEMAWLCAIDLSVIACAIGLIEKQGKAPLLSRLLCLFIGLVTVFLVATASAKMFMYIGSYGLTWLRVLTEVIMVWLAAATVLVCVWLFVPRLPYMKAIVLLALVMGAGVIWTDVDTQVAKYNVRAYQSGTLETVDVAHLTTLGPGAVPYLYELTTDPDPDVAKAAREYLDFCDYSIDDFRGWNLARSQANEVLTDMRAKESAEAAAFLTEQLGLEIPVSQVLHRKNLECLAGKGQTYLRLRLTEDQSQTLLPQLEAAAADSGPWHTLPVSTSLNTLLFARSTACPSFVDDWDINLIPSVDNGYYFFLDRHPEAEDPYDTSRSFLQRSTYHITIAVYDPESLTLYFLTMDTPE